jgi:hypothetical protein
MSGDIHAMAALPLQNEFPTCAYLIGGWVGTRPNIDTLKNRNFCPSLKSNPNFSIEHSITQSLKWLSSTIARIAKCVTEYKL